MDQRFRKSERLKSKKTIDRLFARNNEEILALFSYPLKVSALPGPAEALPQILISVSKRHFKRAVDRNLIKRRIREAYRLNKALLTAGGHAPASIALVYVAKEILSYADIEKKVKVVLRKLGKPEE
ncbi:ribonuclease P protein component [Siphonobacter aquaeclarae]|jgi:ribonuclease P protein component|uniref:Ribonuclease P protein component n=1 Tax=Siphonobacter aquaeclarae TaxID=563176 RepID=A0A1G9MI80_9BACT|nr:ribonuclease P protein component [Siphonobacter aquaeclarae]SDL73968.1 ribonuclease P protein component [Siphonobacter aquaeclarae]